MSGQAKMKTKEETLFEAAQKLPDLAARAAFLDAACANDPALRGRLEELFAAQTEAERFFERGRTEVVLAQKDSTRVVAGERIGDHVGRYKLLELLGEGGFGAVYVAEQTEPVRRRVALKVIKLGMDTKAVVARFEAERQALAMMDHPNIAKVLDAGATETGRPFFVMELVRGIKITEYCDQQKTSTRDRLDLFIKVCQAIQHAHQKGIIHRDIKPSNVLVTLHDGVPVPKVIDFGIAKATEGRLTNATVYTQLHQFIGTPAYMSPEQAEMSGLDMDTRSDIYSLGVLLYELLTGKTPFDAEELISMGLDAMRRTIREREPARPSTKLATLHGEELTTTAQRRSIDTTRLLHSVQGDLDWIAMKCLEKDRTRRYDTAIALAADVLRHLHNEPVTAAAPTFRYRATKFCRRYRTPLAVAAAFAVLLTAATAVSLWQAVRATQAEVRQARLRAKAEADERRARETAEQNERMATVLGGMVRTFNPLYWMEKGVDGWSEPLDALTQQAREAFAAKPEAEAEWCKLMAELYHELVLRQKLLIKFSWRVWGQKIQDRELNAENPDFQSRWVEVTRRCLELNRAMHPGDHPVLAESLAGLGNALFHGGQLTEAETQLQAAVDMYRRLGEGESVAFARALSHYAIALRLAGRTNAAQAAFREATSRWAPLTDAAPKPPWEAIFSPGGSGSFLGLWNYMPIPGPQANLGLAKVIWNHDFPLAVEWQLLRVEKLCHPEHHILAQTRPRRPDGGSGMRHITVTSESVYWMEISTHTGLRRGPVLWETLVLEREDRGPSHRLVRALRRDILSIDQLANGMKFAEYQDLLREEPAYVRQRFAGDLETMEHELELLAEDYAASGAMNEAIALLREVRNSRVARLPADDPNVARAAEALADLLALARRCQQGQDVVPRLMPGRTSTFKEWVRSRLLRVDLDPHEEPTLCQEALPGWRKLYADDPPRRERLLALTAQALEQDYQFDEARSLWRELSQSYPQPATPMPTIRRTTSIPGTNAVVAIQPSQTATPPSGVSPTTTPGARSAVPGSKPTGTGSGPAAVGEQMLVPVRRGADAYWEKGEKSKARLFIRQYLDYLDKIATTNSQDTFRSEHLAVVRLWLGQTNEHLALCEKLQARGTNHPATQHRAAIACLVHPGLEPALRQQAVTAGLHAVNLAGKDNTNLGWFLITAALANLRDGKAADAEAGLTEFLERPDEARDRKRLAQSCRALARARLGRSTDALVDLAAVEEDLPQYPARPALSPLLFDLDLIVTRLLCDEARALLNAPSASLRSESHSR